MEDPGLLAVSADQQIAVRLSDGLKLRAVPFEGFTGCTACSNYTPCLSLSARGTGWIPNRCCLAHHRADKIRIVWVPANRGL